MAKVAGTAYITVNGVQYPLRGNMTCELGSTERESVTGLDGYHGYKETPKQSSITCEFTDQPGLDLNVLEALTGVTVTVQLINGKVATLTNATQMNHLGLNVEDGKYTVKFEGAAGTWSVPTQTSVQAAS